MFDQLVTPANLGSPYLIFNSSNVYFEDCEVNNFRKDYDIELYGSTNFTAINTYFDLDFIGQSVMHVDHSSRAELYGVTINPGGWPYSDTPIEILNTSAWVNIYRWLYLNVTDLLNIPLGATTVSTKNLNLNEFSPIPRQCILDYLDKGNISDTEYNITNSSGYVILPLITDNLTYSSVPNSIFVGNYHITAYYDQYSTSMNVGLDSYPIILAGANNPKMTLKFSDLLISPKNNTYFDKSISDIEIDSGIGTIRDSVYQKPQGGVVDMTFGQQGNIRIGGTGTLNLLSTGLGIEQDANHKYYILIEENGKINLEDQSAIMDGVVTPGQYPVNIYVNDSSEMTLKEGSVFKNIGALGIFRNSKITFDNSEIHGGLLYANGVNRNLIIKAQNQSRINMSSLSLSTADVTLENTNISTNSIPIMSNIDLDASNCTFNKHLTFTNGSAVKLKNVTKPDFFNISAKDTSLIEVYWWLTVIVKDSQGNRLQGVKVTVRNYTKNAVLSTTPYDEGYTDENGEFTLVTLGGLIYFDPVSGKCRRQYGGIYGNYNITASFAGSIGSPSSRSTGNVHVFGQNQEYEIIIPGGPDLVIESDDISYSPDTGIKGERVYVNATVHNQGSFNASNIRIEFWDEDRDTQLGDTKTIPNLEPGQSKKVSIIQYFLIEGEYRIKVEVDPDNEIGETNEKNNVANNTITVLNLDKPDLTYVANSLFTTPPSPISNRSKITASVYINNIGNAESDSFRVRFYAYYIDSKPEIEYWNSSDIIVGGLATGETTLVQSYTQWEINRTGNYRLEAVIDVSNQVEEWNEENNTITRLIEVVVGPDLTVTSIGFIPNPPITREKEFAITATIVNVGPSNATNINVSFYLDTTNEDDLIDMVMINYLNSSESKNVEIFTTISEAGEYNIWAKADPYNSISEIIEDNNSFNKELIIVKKADLNVDDIQFKYLEIENNIETNITAIIKNEGETTSETFTIRVYDGDPAHNGKQIKEIGNIPGLKADESKPVVIVWSSDIGGWHDIWVEVESIDEEDDKNNIKSERIYVMTKPDLFVYSIITDKETDQILVDDTVVKINISIKNGGDTNAQNFEIELWDGPPEVGKEYLTRILIYQIEGNTIRNETIEHTFLTDGNHHIHVIVDPDNVIPESNEKNNTATKIIFVSKTAPDIRLLTDIDEIIPKIEGVANPLEPRVVIEKEKFDFIFEIINEGSDIADNFTVLVLDETNEIFNKTYTLNFVQQNQSIEIQTPLFEAKYKKDIKGHRKITIWIDPDNRIKETNENNNIYEFDGYKVIKSNLALNRIEIYREGEQIVESQVKKGDILTLRAYVKNMGSEKANATVRFTVDGTPKDTPFSSIEPDPDQEALFILKDQKIETSSAFIISAEAISKERESDYNDNIETKTIEGSGSSKDSKDNFMLLMMILLIVIIIIICAVVGAVLYLKKKREKMAECSECGALIPVETTACPKCGAEFSDEIECGECGALMKITDTKCPVCGASFTKEGEEGELGPMEEGEGEEKPKPGKAPPAPDKETTEPAPGKKVPAPKAKAAAAKTPSAVAAAPAPAGAIIPPPPSKPTGAPPAAAPVASAADEDEEKAECYRCGAIVPLSASMCPECGAEFE